MTLLILSIYLDILRFYFKIRDFSKKHDQQGVCEWVFP